MRNAGDLSNIRYIRGFYSVEKELLIEEILEKELKLTNESLFKSNYDLYYLGSTKYNRIFIVVNKSIIYNYEDILKYNLVKTKESKWLKLLKGIIGHE